jgi:hypothetical protein
MGVGGKPGSGGGICPAGAFTALSIVVFDTDSDVRLVQALDVVAAAARATVWVAGTRAVLMTSRPASHVRNVSGRIDMCNIA